MLGMVAYQIEALLAAQRIPEAVAAAQSEAELLRSVTPCLDEARLTRTASLRHGPAGAASVDQRSCIVVPLIAQRELLGLLYADIDGLYGRFEDSDAKLTGMLASQAALALANVRASEGLERKVQERTSELEATTAQAEQRAAELAVINSIQQGISGSRDFQDIIDLVGEKLCEVFAADVVGVALYDRARDILSFPYLKDHGERYYNVPQGPARKPGITSTVIATGVPAVFGSSAEMAAFQRDRGIESRTLGGDTPDNSFIYSPLTVAGEVIGAVVIGKQPEHAFSASAVALVSPVGARLRLALQNARSFEAERQRAADLAVINSTQQGISAELNYHAIVELVGDKLRDVMDAQSVLIGTFDLTQGVEHILYSWEKGERAAPLTRPLPKTRQALIETRASIFHNRIDEAVVAQHGNSTVPGTQTPKAAVFVPMIAGENVTGYLSIQNVDRYDAFSDDDVRLMQTLAGSMGTALENARLFDETQRLLKQTEQRNAELAVINSIQQGMAGALDFQGIVELVGRKLGEVLGSQDMGIRWYDHDRKVVHYLYEVEHGKRLDMPSAAPRSMPWDQLVAQREPRGIDLASAQMTNVPGTDVAKAAVTVPIVGSARELGSIIVENHDSADDF